jgi:hypothetical protein
LRIYHLRYNPSRKVTIVAKWPDDPRARHDKPRPMAQ